MRKVTLIILIVLSVIFGSLITSSIVKMLGDKIVVIPIEGAITTEESGGLFSPVEASSSKIISYIKKANKDESVKGIIFEINSPGGTVVATAEIVNAIKQVKKPKVAWIREVGASGAYWVASSCDEIVVDPMSITGSIGVLSSYLEFSGLMEKYGVGYERLAAGEYKDTGSPYRKLTPEERRLLQAKIDAIYNFFVGEVAKNRNLSEDKVKSLATGMFYLGSEAKELGLVDYLGGRELAFNLTREAANITEANLVVYKEKKGMFDLLGKLLAYSSYYVGKGIGSEFFASVKEENPLEIVM